MCWPALSSTSPSRTRSSSRVPAACAWLEWLSPGPPALCAAGRHAGAIVGAGNTLATPLLQQPLALGADVVVRSATKFIGGHSDLLSGITVAREQALAQRLRHRTAAAQMTGFGAVLAFEVPDAPAADRLCDALRVIVHATSLGGVESTIERRSKLPGQEHVPPGLLRLSAGCEHIDDLWNDLNSALAQASRPENGTAEMYQIA